LEYNNQLRWRCCLYIEWRRQPLDSSHRDLSIGGIIYMTINNFDDINLSTTVLLRWTVIL
jgi:hypothetical protein